MGLNPKLLGPAAGAAKGLGLSHILHHNSTLRFTKSGDLAARISGLDELFRTFMEANGISAASCAAVKGGSRLAHRGYGLHVSPVTIDPDSLFRLASVSKTFTCALLTRLVATGRLNWNTKAFDFLGVDTPLPGDAVPHSLMKAVTVQQLVEHPSWLPRGIDHLGISKALGLDRPPTRNEIVRYVYGTKKIVRLGKIKPTEKPYSNYGYVVLTAVAEKAAQLDFTVAIQKEVLDPLGLTGVWRGVTAASGRLPGEVLYTSEGEGPSRFAPRSAGANEPLPYGGDFILENSEGTGGLVANAMTVARTVSAFAAWGVGGRAPDSARSGGFAGTCTFTASLPSGVDYAFLCNASVEGPALDGFVKQVNELLAAA